MTAESSKEKNSPVKLVSITLGDMDKKLSWSDVNALLEQAKATERALLHRIESLEQSRVASEERMNLLGEKVLGEGSSKSVTESVREEGDKFELPESTYSLLITEDILSVPFAVGLVGAALSMMCLILALINELDKGTVGNDLGLPAGANTEVRVAQFLGNT